MYDTLISEYIQYKISLGYKMAGIEEKLRRFDKYATERQEVCIGITKSIAEEWMAPFPNETDYNRYLRIAALRGFSLYLQFIGYNSYIPTLPKCKSTFTPYIFTKTEIAKIFQECDRLTLVKHCKTSVKCVIPALIRLLYGTGIRISEATKLKHSDVNLDEGFLHLKDCKNRQDRLVPLSLSVREVCKDYIKYKQSLGIPIDEDTPFFTSAHGLPVTPASISTIFRTVLYRAGIPLRGSRKGPRLHDLRHTFCVNALLQLIEKGSDLYCSMPILMAYMGHKSIDSTNRYVRLTEEMYPNVIKNLDNVYNNLFPNMGTIIEE